MNEFNQLVERSRGAFTVGLLHYVNDRVVVDLFFSVLILPLRKNDNWRTDKSWSLTLAKKTKI